MVCYCFTTFWRLLIKKNAWKIAHFVWRLSQLKNCLKWSSIEAVTTIAGSHWFLAPMTVTVKLCLFYCNHFSKHICDESFTNGIICSSDLMHKLQRSENFVKKIWVYHYTKIHHERYTCTYHMIYVWHVINNDIK